MSKKKPSKKVLKTFLMPADLAEWAKAYAKSNNITVTRLILDHLMELRKKADGYVEQV